MRMAGFVIGVLAGIMMLVAAPGAHAASPGTKTVTVAVADAFGTNPTAATWGRVRSAPGGIDCPTDCTADFAHGSTLTLTVTPARGYEFSRWQVSGNAAACDSAPVCTLTIGAGDAAEVAAMMNPQASLLLTPQGAGAVTVVPAEAGQPPLVCTGAGATCLPRYPKGTRVTLTATPDPTVPGARFVRWSDYRCRPAARSCTLTMDGQQWVTAVFEPVFLTVESGVFGPVSVSPPGVQCTFPDDPATGSPAPCRIPYALGPLVTITRDGAVTPPASFGWTGACSGTDVVCRVRMRKDQFVVAGGPPLAQTGPGQSMRFGYAGAKGGRIVVREPGSRDRTCRRTCTLSGFRPDSRIQVRAAGSKRVTFSKWSDIRVRKASRSIYVGDPTAVQATFKKKRRR